jgi:hypothetical protein
MEELELEEFVDRVFSNEELRAELRSDPSSVIVRERLSPKVAQTIIRLIPHLSMDRQLDPSLCWWRC